MHFTPWTPAAHNQVPDATADPGNGALRRYHLVFDLDETLIFNPPGIPRMAKVRPHAPALVGTSESN